MSATREDLTPALRAATPEDDAILWEIYRSSRAEEVRAFGWPDAQADAFLRMQWDIERRARAMQHPDADHQMLTLGGRTVGRVLIDRAKDHVLIVDLALLPDARARGVGSHILQTIIAEANVRRVPVRLSVMRNNPAGRLYRRLGFAVVGEDAFYFQMSTGVEAPRAAAE
jgi:ribosomal protein S18 acetylase RimI-like enzyme